MCTFLEAGAGSEPFPVQFWAVMTTREHGRASIAWESQCSVHMPLAGENCLPMPWLIPAWFFHDMKWECSGQLACLAACAPSQGNLCWEPAGVRSQLPACPGHHSMGAGPQLLQSIPHPTNLPASSCPCPVGRVIYNPGQPHGQLELSPTKTPGSSTEGKREA